MKLASLALLLLAPTLSALAPIVKGPVNYAKASGNTLTNLLVSHWDMDEASGTRADSLGANDLTDNNTVTQGAGKIGNSADFVAVNSEFLSVADNASLDFTTVFSLQAWIMGTPVTANACIAAKWNYMTDGGWAIQLDAGTGLTIFVAASAADAGDNWLRYEAAGFLDNTWHHLVVTFNNGAIIVYIDGNTVDSSASAGVIPSSLRNSAADLRLGNFQGLGRYWQGRQDEVAIWNRTITASEVTSLYNGGAGLAYPFTP